MENRIAISDKNTDGGLKEVTKEIEERTRAIKAKITTARKSSQESSQDEFINELTQHPENVASQKKIDSHHVFKSYGTRELRSDRRMRRKEKNTK